MVLFDDNHYIGSAQAVGDVLAIRRSDAAEAKRLLNVLSDVDSASVKEHHYRTLLTQHNISDFARHHLDRMTTPGIAETQIVSRLDTLREALSNYSEVERVFSLPPTALK